MAIVPRTVAAMAFMPAIAWDGGSPASRRMPMSSSTGRIATGVLGPRDRTIGSALACASMASR